MRQNATSPELVEQSSGLLCERSSTVASLQEEVNERQVYPYNEGLLERARTQWQAGQWEDLAKIDQETIFHHPDRAKLALLAAAGRLQRGDNCAARQFICLALEWGCSKRLVSQILIAGVHNCLARAAAVGGHAQRAIKHFEASLSIGTPGSGLRLIIESRISEQFAQLGLSSSESLKSRESRDPANPLAPQIDPFEGLMYELKKIDASSTNRPLQGKTILILLWFRSLVGGGLHEHVRDTVDAIMNAGGNAIIACPESSLSKDLSQLNTIVIETDYDDPFLIDKIIDQCPNISLIHAHPGPSRKVAIEINNRISVPIIFTVHGGWFDGIDGYFDEVSHVIAVSEFICDSLRKKIPQARSRISVIPNGVDGDIFNTNDTERSARDCAVFSGRVDKDKSAGLDLMKMCWVKQSQGNLPAFKWYVAGDGPLLDELKAQAKEIFAGKDNHIEFVGWIDRKSLANLLKKACISLSGGRSCLESLACGCLSIATAAEKPIIIKDYRSFQEAAYSNFGGFGSGEAGINEDEVLELFKEVFTGNRKFSPNSDVIRYIEENLTKKAVGRLLIQLYVSEINRRV